MLARHVPRAAAIGAVLLSMLGCGGGATGARTPRRSLPPYEGHQTELYDDALEPKAVGYELDRGVAPLSDPLLRERVQVGDAVLRVRVTTVTSKDEDSGRSYQIGVRTLEKLAGGQPPQESDFVLSVGRTSPSAGLLRAFESRLVGMKFMAFLRAFARDGEEELHFHLAPDSKDELAAINAAASLDDLR
jgi:hypothetical protein